jgi:zinc transport system permease protein
MMDLWHKCLSALPFSWAQYEFMRNALLGILLSAPMFGFLGTMVVSNRMVFFSDVLGHASLTGIAFGVILGVSDPVWAVVVFCVFLAVLVNILRAHTHASSDTILGVFYAITVAGGIVLLSKGGGFARYSSYLIGDILTVSPGQLQGMALLFVCVLLYWFYAGNTLVLASLDPAIARSRGVNVFWIELSFSVLLALTVAVCIRLVGVLIINSLLVLPAAAARIHARRFSDYTVASVCISTGCGILGLIASYYWSTASGATIVLLCACVYIAAVLFHGVRSRA